MMNDGGKWQILAGEQVEMMAMGMKQNNDKYLRINEGSNGK